MTSQDLDFLARRIVTLERKHETLARSTQLNHSSVRTASGDQSLVDSAETSQDNQDNLDNLNDDVNDIGNIGDGTVRGAGDVPIWVGGVSDAADIAWDSTEYAVDLSMQLEEELWQARAELETALLEAETALSEAELARQEAADAVTEASAAVTQASNAVSQANNAVSQASDAASQASNAVVTALAADQKATTAQTTANGKNKVVRSAQDASSPGSYVAGDQWWKYTGSEITGLWIHNGSSWVSQTLTNSVITNLDAGSITTGFLSSDRLQAGSIEVDKLVVGDFDNYFGDVLFSALTYPGWDKVDGGLERFGVGSEVGTYLIRTKFAIEDTGTYLFRIKRSTLVGPTNYQLRIYIQQSVDGVTWGTAGAPVAQRAFIVNQDGYNTYVWSPQPGQRYARVGFYTNSTFTSASRTRLEDFSIRRMGDGQLIVDGAIVASKISSEAVTADKIQASAVTAEKIQANAVISEKIAASSVVSEKIQAGAVIAEKIATNAIVSEKIQAGAVIADKIATNAVTAIKILAGAVTADKIATNAVTADKILAGSIDGMTITGALIRTAPSGQRMQFDVNGLRSFNSSGLVTSSLAAATGGLVLGGPLISYGDVTSTPFNSLRMILNNAEVKFEHTSISGYVDTLRYATNGIYSDIRNNPFTISNESMSPGSNIVISPGKNGKLHLDTSNITSVREPKLLWSGAAYMTAAQTINLAELVTDQLNGIVLLWSEWNGSAQNYGWNHSFVAKSQVVGATQGSGVSIPVAKGNGDSSVKYVYISNDKIVGHANNNSGTNSGIVLRQVIGI